MLLVAVALATLIIKTVVSRDPGNEGFLIKAWCGIIKTISEDKTDEVSGQPPAEAGGGTGQASQACP